jgi:hypothetical protein
MVCGLGLALLHHAFGAFYVRGRHLVGLAVDSQSLTGATRVYERAGMRVTERYDTCEKVIYSNEQNIEPARIVSALCGEHSTGSIFLHIAVVSSVACAATPGV